MTDAREYMISDERKAALDNENAIADAKATLTAAGYRILGPDDLRALKRALSKAEDGAGTLPARDSVKLRPADWQALAMAIRSIGRKT